MTPPLAVEFFADGHRLDGDLHLPAAGDAPAPVLIALSGYLGLKGIHPARFARALTPRGWAVLCFDYRGFGRSDGERGRIIPQEQAEDVRAAVSFLATVPAVDAGRIGLLGWALGGAVAIAAAADDDRVRAVAAVNGIAAGERTTRALHDTESWGALREAIEVDRRQRATGEPSRLIPPFDLLPLPPVTRAYVESELLPAPGYGSQVSLEAAEWHLRFRPEDLVARISPRPLLLHPRRRQRPLLRCRDAGGCTPPRASRASRCCCRGSVTPSGCTTTIRRSSRSPSAFRRSLRMRSHRQRSRDKGVCFSYDAHFSARPLYLITRKERRMSYRDSALQPAVTRDETRTLFAPHDGARRHHRGVLRRRRLSRPRPVVAARASSGSSPRSPACSASASPSARSEQLSIGLLFGFGVLIGLAVAPTIAYYAKHRSRRPSGRRADRTALFIAGFGAAGYATRRDLSALARVCFFALIALIVFGIVLIFVNIPGGQLIYAILGLVIFAGFTMFDFQRLRKTTRHQGRADARGVDLPRHPQRLPAAALDLRRRSALGSERPGWDLLRDAVGPATAGPEEHVRLHRDDLAVGVDRADLGERAPVVPRARRRTTPPS